MRSQLFHHKSCNVEMSHPNLHNIVPIELIIVQSAFRSPTSQSTSGCANHCILLFSSVSPLIEDLFHLPRANFMVHPSNTDSSPSCNAAVSTMLRLVASLCFASQVLFYLIRFTTYWSTSQRHRYSATLLSCCLDNIYLGIPKNCSFMKSVYTSAGIHLAPIRMLITSSNVCISLAVPRQLHLPMPL